MTTNTPDLSSELATGRFIGAPQRISARDLLQLTKPRITGVVVFTTASGLWMAPGATPPLRVALTLLGTGLVVSAANALNMYLERDSDALMPRTANRPLPAGRLSPGAALAFGLGLAGVSVPLLTFAVGPWPGLLAALALVSYVLVYTPMKRWTPTALLVGAVPGAIPPLIGWSAATGGIELQGVLLFCLMFLWQVPHFLAITLFRRDDYARAGMQVQANLAGGEEAVRANIVRYAVAQVGTSLVFVPLGMAGRLYLGAAVAMGALFLVAAFAGLRPAAGPRWARGLFLQSLLYVTVVFGALMVDRTR
jgi:protoheme IX farnesyltransferase